MSLLLNQTLMGLEAFYLNYHFEVVILFVNPFVILNAILLVIPFVILWVILFMTLLGKLLHSKEKRSFRSESY